MKLQDKHNRKQKHLLSTVDVVKRYKWKRSRRSSSSRYDHNNENCMLKTKYTDHTLSTVQQKEPKRSNKRWLDDSATKRNSWNWNESFVRMNRREREQITNPTVLALLIVGFFPLTLLLCVCVSDSVCMYLSCNCCCPVDVALLNSLVRVSFCLYSQSHSQG